MNKYQITFNQEAFEVLLLYVPDDEFLIILISVCFISLSFHDSPSLTYLYWRLRECLREFSIRCGRMSRICNFLTLS